MLNACSTRPELEPVPEAQPPGPEAPGPEDPDKPGKPDNPDKPGDKPDEPGEPDEPEDPGKAGPDQVLNATYTPDETSIFRNPERGLHTEYNLLNGGAPHNSGRSDISLVRTSVRLDDWRNSRLPDRLLTDLDRGFDALRQHGYKAVLRFSYNFGDGPDAPLNRVLEHIDQLQPVLERNADVIAVLHAGFIGRWGEWHGSNHGLDTASNKRIITEALLEALPDSRMLQIRSPYHISDVLGGFQPLSEEDAFSTDMQARIGYLNDCFLAGADNAGTYPDGAEGQRYRDYMAALAPWTMTGGETCTIAFESSAQLQSCPSATQELELFGWDYLNLLFYTGVLNRWRDGGCFDDIARSLGYRYELHDAEISTNADGTLDVRLGMENAGYGNLYNPRPLQLVLSRDGREHRLDLTDDARHDLPLAGEGRQTLEFRDVNLPGGIADGSWELSLALPDADPDLADRPEYSIRLASRSNDGNDFWSASRGVNRLGLSLTVAAD
ncbi:MAG TPA: DUF4832 domain-containing protein [Deinococcales bacterium]|nr:DUF4832 domain-containing protein [Deinococcales bacterium]